MVSQMLDPQGAEDRAEARDTLASRFQIVGSDHKATAGNQVTDHQYEEIVQTYSDIRLGRSDLKVSPEGLSGEAAEEFKFGAMGDIADILQTRSGRGLVGSLANAPRNTDFSSRVTRIKPSKDAENARGGKDGEKAAQVSYQPGMNHGGDNPIRSDVTLYHELVHARHAVNHTWDSPCVHSKDGASKKDVSEKVSAAEHQAVGLGKHALAPYSENRYRGERRAIGEATTGGGGGQRLAGAHTDDEMTRRNQYVFPESPSTTPAEAPESRAMRKAWQGSEPWELAFNLAEGKVGP
jgi:hypothetical protein